MYVRRKLKNSIQNTQTPREYETRDLPAILHSKCKSLLII